jgi:hypothetical protein
VLTTRQETLSTVGQGRWEWVAGCEGQPHWVVARCNREWDEASHRSPMVKAGHRATQKWPREVPVSLNRSDSPPKHPHFYSPRPIRREESIIAGLRVSIVGNN